MNFQSVAFWQFFITTTQPSNHSYTGMKLNCSLS